MRDEKWSLGFNTPEDRGLIDSVLIMKRAIKQQQEGKPCPLHKEREDLIWAYADGFLEETREDEAWEEIGQCRYCLDRLAAVQRALSEAEERMALEPVLEPEPVPVPIPEWIGEPEPALESEPISALMKEWILALFNVKWEGGDIRRERRALAVTELQLVPVLGEEKRIRRGQLSRTWNGLQVTIEAEVHLEPQDRTCGIVVSIDLRDQIGEPVSQTHVDFCDIDGEVMETSVTDDEGRVGFSSWEGHRFVRGDGPQVEIGFCLELTRGGESASWQILIGQGSLNMTTTTD